MDGKVELFVVVKIFFEVLSGVFGWCGYSGFSLVMFNFVFGVGVLFFVVVVMFGVVDVIVGVRGFDVGSFFSLVIVLRFIMLVVNVKVVEVVVEVKFVFFFSLLLLFYLEFVLSGI